MGLPGRYQQVEIPAPTSELTEWRRHSLKCGGCGHTTKADVPDEALQRFGPRLKAMIASLGADKRQTNRQLQQLLSDLYEVDVSVGQIVNVAREVGGLLMPAAKRLRDEILSRAAVYADETSWRVARARAYLWGLFSRDAAYYEIHGTRSGEVAEQLIPVGYTGVVHTDDYGGYNHIADERRQLCWAHLKRHFQKRAESRDGPAAALEREFGLRGLRICERVFELSRQSTARQRARLVADMDALVADGLCAGATKDTRTMATTLAKRRGSLWHCLYSADVDATNNHAERYIRPAVIKRKLSLGSGSQGGAQALAALMSVATTARMRGRSPLVFIEATVRAAQNGQPLPVMS
jgi:transposase